MEDNKLNDIYRMKNILQGSLSKDIISRNYSQYINLIKLYCELYGGIPEDALLDEKEQNRLENLGKTKEEMLDEYIAFIEKNVNYLRRFSSSNLKMLENMDFARFYFPSKKKVFDMVDYLGIIYDFFEKYGYIDIVYKYFMDQRVNLVTGFKHGHGEFIGLPCLQRGYIKSVGLTSNSETLSVIAHELGHAIDSETFLFPQQKKNCIFSDLLIEVPSTAFEILFNDYLVENHIDVFGGLLLKNQKTNVLKVYSEILDTSLSYNKFFYDDHGNIIDAETNHGYDNMRYAILYGIGYHMAYHLLLIARDNPQEFKKIYNNIITSRLECNTLGNVIDFLGVSREDFVDGKLIKPVLEEDYLKLRKKLQRF